MGEFTPELIPNAQAAEPEAPMVPDYDMVKGLVQSGLHQALAMQGLVASGTLPLIEITGKGAHKPNDQVDKILATGQSVHANYDGRGKLKSVDVRADQTNIEHAEFDKLGRLTQDEVGRRTPDDAGSAKFKYDSNHRVTAVSVISPAESSYYLVDEKGDASHAVWAAQNEVDEFDDNADKRITITTKGKVQTTATFNYDMNNQFKDGQIRSDMSVTKFKPNKDGVPEVTSQDILL